MKLLVLVLCLLLNDLVNADSFYAVKLNDSVFPLPYELPELGKRPADDFDWERYISDSKSDADRAFRKRIARWEYGQAVAGGGDSTTEHWSRSRLAAEEFKSKCDDLVRRYRKKLEGEPEVLKDLNAYIQQSERAIALQVKLVGGSWGGSGAKVAFARARMHGYLNYYRNLEALGSSLHLQDLSE